MSGIEKRGLPPLGIKGGSISGRDAQDYAKELIRDAFFGLGAFHPDGGMISDRKRLDRLRSVQGMIGDLAQRVTNHEGKRTLDQIRADSIPLLEQQIRKKIEALDGRNYGVYPRRIVPPRDGDWKMELSDWDGKRRNDVHL